MHILRSFVVRGLTVSCMLVSGCVEREERLKISPGGSVLYQVTHTADSLEELYDGDAVPRIAGGWVAEQQEERNDEGEVKYRLSAEASFSARDALPSTFALRGEALAEAYLQFPTSVKIEKRTDGTYYHFARRYEPRPMAAIERLRAQTLIKPLEDMEGKSPSEWSAPERVRVARAIAAFEIARLQLFARAAFVEATPDHAQDGWLAASADLRAFVDQLAENDLFELVGMIVPVKDNGAPDDVEFHFDAKPLLLAGRQRLADGLTKLAGYDAGDHSRFNLRLEREERTWQVTDDLGDDRFRIIVNLPGEIVASNAHSSGGGTATWEFGGGDLRDQAMELLATSRVGRD